MKKLLVMAALLSLASLVWADETKEAKEEPMMDSTKMEKKEPEIQKTEHGVMFQDLVVGEGKECKIGSNVECHYTLWIGDSTGVKGDKVDSSHDRNATFKCTLGSGLIQGWSEGMVGMKEGGSRRLIIEPSLGYGARGVPPRIPGNSWLVFEIDFVTLIK